MGKQSDFIHNNSIMKNILEKIRKIQEKELSFKKTKLNPFTKSKYCPLDEIATILNPVFKELNLLRMNYCEWGNLITKLIDMDSSEELQSSIPINAQSGQTVGAEITYFRRYNISCLLNIISEEDNDLKWGKKEKEPAKQSKFTQKQYSELIKRAQGKSKPEVMQKVLKIQKDYEISEDGKKKLDLFLSQLQ